MGETLFIADVHLSPERPAIIEGFLQFLTDYASKASSLYILGDLFDAWIGDDDDIQPYPEIISALKVVSNQGVKVAVQHGNRDFLLGSGFAKAAGCQLLPDPYKIDLYGVPTLLMHGDLLCTADVAYQKFRRFARNPLLKQLFLLRRLATRRKIALDYRQRSSVATAAKPGAIMDVSQDAVLTYMRRFQVQRLIHGHTHRPGRHEFTVDNTPVERWVLAEWHPDRPEFLRFGDKEVSHPFKMGTNCNLQSCHRFEKKLGDQLR